MDWRTQCTEIPVFGSFTPKEETGKAKLQYEAYLLVGFLIPSCTCLGILEPTACEETIRNKFPWLPLYVLQLKSDLTTRYFQFNTEFVSGL